MERKGVRYKCETKAEVQLDLAVPPNRYTSHQRLHVLYDQAVALLPV